LIIPSGSGVVNSEYPRPAVCPFSFARPKENGRKVTLYGIPHIIDYYGCGKKGAEIETHESIATAHAVNFGMRGRTQ
jgi:hypothetical protein